CLAQTTDAIPRVILLGRLCLYGPRAARLHEVIVPVTARWVEISQRKGQPLKPFKEDQVAESKTLDLLEEALLPAGHPKVNKVIQEKLPNAAPPDIRPRLPHLEERGQRLAEEPRVALAKRGQQEAEAMQKILEQQKRRVSETVKLYEGDSQLLMNFAQDEQRQIQANQRHWEKRLAAI